MSCVIPVCLLKVWTFRRGGGAGCCKGWVQMLIKLQNTVRKIIPVQRRLFCREKGTLWWANRAEAEQPGCAKVRWRRLVFLTALLLTAGTYILVEYWETARVECPDLFSTFARCLTPLALFQPHQDRPSGWLPQEASCPAHDRGIYLLPTESWLAFGEVQAHKSLEIACN